MDLKQIKKVGIVGAGTMGQGIAQVIALSGYEVILYDINEDTINSAHQRIIKSIAKGVMLGKVTPENEKASLSRIQITTHLEDVVADLIIEAIVEKLEAKVAVLTELEKLSTQKRTNALERCIFASNTSSIPITQIAAALEHPNRVIGMHFFNPAHIMKLVEIIPGIATGPEVTKLIWNFTDSLQKSPVLAKDSPGFIVNRVARHFYVESLKILEEGIADPETLDDLLETTGFKMGPFKLMDLIGIDTNFAVTSSLYNAFYQEPKFRPSILQKQKIDAGYLGKKSGKGFYNYNEE